MILVNKATTPENTVYFIAAALNGVLQREDGLYYSELYNIILRKIHKSKINLNTYTLALDFLYLLNKIYINKEGKIYVYKESSINK